jgi:hypothetical protein
MRRLLSSRPVEQALRGASLVVTDRRWAAPLSAAALGFGVFAGVAIGPGTPGSLATGAQQIIQIPVSGGDDGQSGGGDGGVASTESSLPSLGGGGGGGLEEALPSVPLASEPIEPLPAPAPEPLPDEAPAGPAQEEEAEKPAGRSFEGTVAYASPAAGSYAIAIKGGELLSVHAAELPELGTKLSVPLDELANGTYGEAGDPEAVGKRASDVTFAGSVTFANPDPAAPVYAVSGRGASLLVHVEPDPAGAVPTLPAVGSYATVTAKIEEPAGLPPSETEEPQPAETGKSKPESILVQHKIAVDPGPPSSYLEMAVIVKEILPGAGELLLSADSAGEGESSLTLAVPAEIDATKLELGDSYLTTAEVEADGSLLLRGIVSDERRKGADDARSAQGDLAR